MRVSQEEEGGGGPCSLVPFQNCPMFPCSHTLSECFRTVIFRILFPCSQKLANVPLFRSIFCQCSLVPQYSWETLIHVYGFGQVIAEKCVASGGYSNKFYTEGSAPRSNPLPFYIPFFQKRHPFRIPFIGKRHPFHIPSY